MHRVLGRAVWADAKLGLGEPRHLKRCAVVSPHRWAVDAVMSARWPAPTRVRSFRLGQLREATAWAAS